MNDENGKFCVSCGARLPDDATFCPQCGASVDGNPNPYQASGMAVKSQDTLGNTYMFSLENRGRALARDEIMNQVWGKEYHGDLKVVDVNIRRLRLKIEDDAASPKFISTIWGFGYKWEA